MTRLKKWTLPLGAVGLIAIGLAVPRAAHAVVAALVQVTNTAASPAIVQGIGQQAAQLVEIYCGDYPGGGGGGGFRPCNAVPSNGVMPEDPAVTPYGVPPGQTLVITSVDVSSGIGTPSPCEVPQTVVLSIASPSLSGFRVPWIVPAGTGTAHYVYPSGIAIASGFSVAATQFGTCAISLSLHGYLTAQ
jgi:hypothetical protein